MLEFKNVSGSDKGFNLKDITFSLEKGFVMGIAGKNGAGKSTLFKYILDNRIHYKGEIWFEGQNIRDDFLAFKQKVGFVSEESRFFGMYTIGQNAELLSLFYEKWNQEKFLNALKRMELSKTKRIENLSKGEYLKFQMAFAMGCNAKLYLLDEATGGMDPVFRRDFYKILHELIATEEVTVVMTSHIEEEIELHMDYIGIMEAGEMKSFGEVEI